MTRKSKTSKSEFKPHSKLRIGLVVPHIFMQDKLLPDVIFSPGNLAVDLADSLAERNLDVTLFTPGPVATKAKNISSDLSYFERELDLRGYGYIELLKKHPLSFISLSRQVQSEILAKVFLMANEDQLDIVHIYTNEEDTALPFSALCNKPVLFTHHDPFNFLITYRNNFPKYKELKWISISYAQRSGMPDGTNWIGNVYHGLDPEKFMPNFGPTGGYLAYVGRIIEPKGVHLAIAAVKRFNKHSKEKYKLRIAGKHYSGHKKDTYWTEHIEPLIDGEEIIYEGFLDFKQKCALVSNATATLMPSLFEEPFGLSAIESLACGTPVIALNSGALPEVIKDGLSGIVVDKKFTAEKQVDEAEAIEKLSDAIGNIDKIDRHDCRKEFESKFTIKHMSDGYADIYKNEHDQFLEKLVTRE